MNIEDKNIKEMNIEDKLELVLITYNRAPYLENTLKQFLDSPFKNCKFTILDNCSPDETADVCDKYSKLFPNMHIIRHNRNIGVNANLAEALLTSTMEYSWLLGDNDSYDFSDCDDVINAILSDKYDFIYVSSPNFPTNKKVGQEKDLTEIVEEYNPEREIHAVDLVNLIKGKYFWDLSFMSSYIFKTKHYTSDEIIKSFNNLQNLLPYFTFISKTVNENLLLYRSKRDLVMWEENPENDPEHAYTNLKLYEGWLNLALMIKDDKIRKICYKNLDNLSIPGNYLVVLPASIATDKVLGKSDVKFNVISLMADLYKHAGWIKGFLLSIYLFIFYLIPTCVYKPLFKRVCKHRQFKFV